MSLAYETSTSEAATIAAPAPNDEIRDILAGIAGLVADADRRQSEALAGLQARVEALGAQAQSVRDRLPAEYHAAFARIEDGLANVAELIADTEMRAAASAAAAMAPAQHLTDGPAAAAPAGPVDHAAGAIAAATLAGSDEPGLPAIEPATASADVAEDVMPSAPSNVDEPEAAGDQTDMPALHAPLDLDQPWDHEQAEALTRVYEADCGIAPTQPAAVVAVAAATMAPTQAPTSAPAAAPAPAATMDPPLGAVAAPTGPTPAALGLLPQVPAGLEIERSWLETKFAEIASRVEQSLAEMRPESALLALESRFEQFEQRLGHAFDDLSHGADADRIHVVEGHIAELARQIGEAHDQLGRLDGIEQQLVAVMDKLSDPRLERLYDQQAERGPEIDIEAIAAAAADQVALRLAETRAEQAAPADPSAASERIEELRELLAAFISERRHGDEQTAGMLDTMQQAMIRLLDRVEAIEQVAPVDEMPAPSEAPVAPKAAAAPLASVEDRELAPAADARAMADGLAMGVAAGAALAGASAQPHAASAVAPAPAVEPAAEAAAAGKADPRAQPHAAQPASAQPAGDPTRERLIADVRKAMQQAAAQAQIEAATASKTDAPAKAGRKPAPAKAAGGDVAGKGLASRRVMLLCMGLLFSAAAAYLVLPRVMKKPAQAPIERTRVVPQAPETGEEMRGAPTRKGAALDSGSGLESATPLQSGSLAPTERSDDTAVSDITTASLPGITVHQGGAVSAVEIARLRQQEAMAQMSSRLGQAQAAQQAAGVPPLSSAEVAQQGEAGQPAPRAVPAGARVAPLDLPPAPVGPLSMRMAAAEGDPSAEFEVAARYAEGKGVKQDFAKALRWYQRSAAQGFAPSQYRIATLYERGLGAEADLSQARSWYQRAAEQGHVKAMHNLAVLSAGPSASTPDYATAAQWFQQAAEHGLADSQYNLAILHENGLGVRQDDKAAYLWFSLSARNGDKEALRRRDLVKLRLDRADQQAIDAAAQLWRAKPVDRTVNDARVAGEAWKSRAARPEAVAG